MKQIDIWKKRLLDLGLRNKLLNYRVTGKSGLNILVPGIYELYKKLVKQEKTLTFAKVVYETKCRLDENSETDEVLNLIEEKVARVVPGDIETDKEAENLEKTLKTLKDRAKTAVEEQGVNILYLAFGFLEWYEKSNPKQSFLAPLILVPVTIYRENLLSAYQLHLHEDEVLLNPTLQYKLEQDFGIRLPDFNQDSDIEEYFEQLRKTPLINQYSVSEKCALGLFSFLKMNMYFDLEKNKDRIFSNRVLSAMIDKKPLAFDDGFKNTECEKLPFQVVDSDSSQQEALQYAMQGKSFILQGPPGTGKSQTITNIIAAALGVGKKVLFVSEKAAALNVVYQRLCKAGLDNGCLLLHSYKANKKEVLKQLNKTLNSPKVRVYEEAYQKLKALDLCEEHLDGYVKQLHKKIEPLNMSIFEVIGKLLEMENIPNISFSCNEIFSGEINNVTMEKLTEIQRKLDELILAGGRMSCNFRDNPWRYSNIKSLSLTYRSELEAFYKQAAAKLCKLIDEIEKCINNYGLDLSKFSCSVVIVSEIIKLFKMSAIEEKPLVDFVVWENEDIEEKRKFAEVFSVKNALLNELNCGLHKKYFPEVNTIDTEKITAGLKAYSALQIKSFSEDIGVHVPEMEEYCKLFDKVSKNIQNALDIAKMYGMEVFDVKDFNFIKDIFVFCAEKLQPSWLCPINQFTQNFMKVITLEEIYKLEKKFRDKLTHNFTEKIFDTEIECFHGEFINANNWLIPKLHKPYRDFCNELKKCIKPSSYFKLNHQNVMTVYSDLTSWHSYKKEIATVEEIAVNFLGENFCGCETDWNEVKNNAEEFKRLYAEFKEKYFVPLDKVMLATEQKRSDINATPFDREKIISAALFFTLFEKFVAFTQRYTECSVNRVTYYEVISIATQTTNVFRKVLETVADLKKYFRSSTAFIKSEIEKDLIDIKKAQELKTEIEQSHERLQKEFQQLYKKYETDWDSVKKYLDWFENISNFRQSFGCKNVLLQFYQGKSIDTTEVCRLENIFNDFLSDYQKITAMFDEQRNFENAGLEQLYRDIENCADNISLLEEWIDYGKARKSCCEIGLQSYINAAELYGQQKTFSEETDFQYLTAAFCKRFYNEWLDFVLVQAEDVADFRRKKQDALIDEFCTLDLQQFSIAQAKIREKLSMQIPDINNLVSAGDELMILRREIEKKARIMPLRLLFEKIPNLISLLKPCLMMSPLSVSLFLQSNDYHFDMVVFDEASQVRTEDAVGAICRANQVIIAGDKEQLPPTDFFVTNVDEEDDDEIYESILDEMSLVIPQKMLKWHYRSRNESLIAFSNKKIYNDELVTFPSVTTKNEDCGIEYIYVENGVYGRGGSHDNVNEALKVAQLVLRHAKLFPNKTLGVITFSSSQQATIERIILQIRRDNPETAYFFDEERPGAFFVKNLENVQGDERDTIIFSIGYAKDSQNKLSMNFGPLSRNGGYRRLNVAVTRARYNLKLVGSILPEDLKVQTDNAEGEYSRGVAMLKSYMEFAIAAKNTKPSAVILQENENSRFEKMLFELLKACGYNVVQRHGFSNFKIDLAVMNDDGDFVLGIMCDGQMYKSAVTVRERERLRYTMLNEMGWKIYKVWSYEWLKNPDECRKSLLNAVEDALRNNTKTTVVNYNCDAELETFYNVVQEKTTVFIEEYEEADILSIERNLNEKNNDYIVRVADYVIEKEAPINIEVLCMRLAPLLGYKKNCATLQNAVENIFNSHLNHFKCNGDFFVRKDSVVIARKAGNRTINQISPEELEKCILAAIKSSVGIPAENVCLYTSKLMGFHKMTSKISAELERAFKNLITKNQVILANGKVSLVD